jgi:hypothetical protein
MARFGSGFETLEVGRSSRALNLKQASADPVVGAVSLADATARLTDGLQRLPELDGSRSVSLGARAAAPAAAGAERWFLDLDHERVDGTLVRLAGPLGMGVSRADLAAQPLAEDLPLIPIALDPLTVVDDRDFAGRLAVQPNLPERIKRELPGLYGM